MPRNSFDKFLPEVFREFLGTKPWDLEEEDIDKVLAIINRSKDSESLNAGYKIADSSLRVLTCATFGVFAYLFQRYNESHDTTKSIKDFTKSFIGPSSNSTDNGIKDVINIDEYTIDGLIFCGSLVALYLVSNVLIKNYIFASSNAANKIVDKISKMPLSKLERTLEEVDNGIDLADINVSKDQFDLFNYCKAGLSSTAAGLATYYSGLPKDKQYLLFVSLKVVAKQLLDIADETLFLSATEPLFEEGFLPEFSPAKIDELREAIKSEIESNIDKNKCSEALIKFSSDLLKQLAFYGTLQAAPTSSLISEGFFASATHWGTASLSYNFVRSVVELLDNHRKIREDEGHPQVEVLGGDIEMGEVPNNVGGGGGYSPLRNSEIENSETEIPKSTIRRVKSENDLKENPKVVSKKDPQRRNSI